MKKIFKIMIIVLVMSLVLFITTDVFALGTGDLGELNHGTPKADIVIKVKNVWRTVVVIVQVASVVAVVFLGMKYMFSSADTKADIKKQITLLVIGAVLVFSSITVINFIVKSFQAMV